MTNEHLRPLLDNSRVMHTFFRVAEMLAQGDVPPRIGAVLRRGRLTAFQKPGGGVRGIVAGDVIRGLVARTIAQQLGKVVESATAPFQYALSTRAGCECIAHALQSLTELDPEATVLSIDGISAYDLISRKAMLSGLAKVPGGDQVLLFVNMFYSAPSQYWWEDEMGIVHVVDQGEGGEQGDALMPLLFCLGQNDALKAVQASLRPSERLFAFLDDIYIVCKPDRVDDVHTLLESALWDHARIQVHVGKTKVYRAGVRPEACDRLERRAPLATQEARVWRGGLDVNPEVRGIKVLGTPVGHPAYVTTQLQHIRQDQQLLLDRIPLLPDVQSACALLVHCASARATYSLRVVSPEQSFQFATSHDTALWECLGTVVGVPTPHIRSTTHESVCLPLAFGGLGLRSAVRTAAAAYWASWGDSLGMIQQRHPAVVRTLVHELVGGQSQSVHLLAASMAAAQLTSLDGFEVPSWPALAAGDRPPQVNVEVGSTRPQSGENGNSVSKI